MPLLGFSVFKNKLLSGEKTQTIRRPRKQPIKVDDTLYIYWKLRTKNCQKLGEGIVTKAERKRLIDLTEEEARKDGFLDKAGLLAWFLEKHGHEGRPACQFDVIQWKWKDMILIQIGCLFCSKMWRGKDAFNQATSHMDKEHFDEMMSARMTYPINHSRQWKNGVAYQYIP